MTNNLFELHKQRGAKFVDVNGIQLPDVFTSLDEEYAAAHTGAVLYDSSALGRLRLSGSTRIDFVDRMSTNDLASLTNGQGAATILTTPIARIVDRITAYVRDDDLLVLTSAGASESVRAWFARHIFFNDDVQVHDVANEIGLISIYGKQANEIASKLTGHDMSELSLHHWQSIDSDTLIIRADAIAGDGFHIWTQSAERIGELWQAAIDAGALPIGERAFDLLRVESGRPRYGVELSKDFIPLEVALWDDVSFTKGCYTGQEIIARMESRKRLAKKLVGLRSVGAITPGKSIRADGRSIGKVTSAAKRPNGDSIALGVIKPTHAEIGTQVMVDGDPAVDGEVTSLPIP